MFEAFFELITPLSAGSDREREYTKVQQDGELDLT